MKWVWLTGGGCIELNLNESIGLRVREVSFGYVNCSNNKAYDSWNGQCIGQFATTIEAKRHLIDHIENRVANAHRETKVAFEAGEQ